MKNRKVGNRERESETFMADLSFAAISAKKKINHLRQACDLKCWKRVECYERGIYNHGYGFEFKYWYLIKIFGNPQSWWFLVFVTLSPIQNRPRKSLRRCLMNRLAFKGDWVLLHRVQSNSCPLVTAHNRSRLKISDSTIFTIGELFCFGYY